MEIIQHKFLKFCISKFRYSNPPITRIGSLTCTPARIIPYPTGRLFWMAPSQALRARLRSHRPSGTFRNGLGAKISQRDPLTCPNSRPRHFVPGSHRPSGTSPVGQTRSARPNPGTSCLPTISLSLRDNRTIAPLATQFPCLNSCNAALKADSSVKSSRNGVMEVHPFSTAQRSVPGSAFSRGVTVNQ